MLELTNAGLSRENAYKIVQKHAQKSWKNNLSFYDSLIKDKNIMKKISEKKLKDLFDLKYHLKKIDFIYRRVLK